MVFTSCIQNLLTQIPQTAKVLIFSERIEVAEAIYERLQQQFPGQVGRSGQDHTACLYYLYIGSSNEERELLTDLNQELVGVIPVLDLEYEQESQSFLHPGYQTLADLVLAYARRKAWNTKSINEIERNLERGKLSCDWWASEKTCNLRIQSAPSRLERNYWITMRLLVQASLGRLPQ